MLGRRSYFSSVDRRVRNAAGSGSAMDVLPLAVPCLPDFPGLSVGYFTARNGLSGRLHGAAGNRAPLPAFLGTAIRCALALVVAAVPADVLVGSRQVAHRRPDLAQP